MQCCTSIEVYGFHDLPPISCRIHSRFVPKCHLAHSLLCFNPYPIHTHTHTNTTLLCLSMIQPNTLQLYYGGEGFSSKEGPSFELGELLIGNAHHGFIGFHLNEFYARHNFSYYRGSCCLHELCSSKL